MSKTPFKYVNYELQGTAIFNMKDGGKMKIQGNAVYIDAGGDGVYWPR